jgi:hypothetical protein
MLKDLKNELSAFKTEQVYLEKADGIIAARNTQIQSQETNILKKQRSMELNKKLNAKKSNPHRETTGFLGLRVNTNTNNLGELNTKLQSLIN